MVISLTDLLHWLLEYRYWFLFPATVLEGPIATILAGFLISQGLMGWVLTYVVIVAGDLVGDVLYWALGKWGGRSFLQRWGKYVGIRPENIEALEHHFSSHAGKTLFVSKLTHGIGSAFLTAAGVAGMSFRSFVWYNLLGTLPKSLILLLIGFYFGQAYEQLNEYLNYAALAILILCLVAVLVYGVVIKNVMKKITKKEDMPL